MRNLKSVLVLCAACMLALTGCPEDEGPVPEPEPEVCTNAVDDDGDGNADCKDSDCASAADCQAKTEDCDNTLDDDGDGRADCADSDCDAAASCQTPAEDCDNGGLDDDGDDKADCADSDCDAAANCQAAAENCDNGDLDDDGDGKADCEDLDCAAAANCQGCTDGETECGQDCCTNGRETCLENVCVGANPEECLVAASYGEISLADDVIIGTDSSDRTVWMLSGTLPAADSTTDVLSFELHEGRGVFAAGFKTGEFQLTGDETDVATCGLCVMLLADVWSDGVPSEWYLASGGRVKIDSIEGTLTAVLSAGTFVQASESNTSPDADRCASRIEKVTLSGAFPGSEVEEECATTGDEDGDGLADCADYDCASYPGCAEEACGAALELDPSGTTNGDNTNAGATFFEATCGYGAFGREVLYTVAAGTPGTTGVLKISVTSVFDATIYARTTCENASTELGCVNAGDDGDTEVLEIPDYVGGTPVTLFVDADTEPRVGAFTVEVSFFVPVCGNGAVELGEDCEPDFAHPTTDNCKADCTFNPIEIAVDLVSPHAGALADGESAWYKFVAAANGAMTAEITDGATTPCSELYADLGLYEADGTHVATTFYGGTDYCPKLFVPNLPAGTYLLKVEDFPNGGAIDYLLNLTLGAVQACSAPADYGTSTFTDGVAQEGYWGVESQFNVNADPDRISMSFAFRGPFEFGLVAGSYPLTGDELDKNKCAVCLWLTESNGRSYIPTGGGVTLTSVSGTLAGTLTGVTFVEAVNWNQIPNACPTKITSATFSTPITALEK